VRKNKGILILLLVAVLFLSGCNDQRILEDLGFTYTATYDLKSKEKGKVKEMEIGLSIPIAHPEKKKDREVLLISAESSKEARVRLSGRTSRTLVSGQLRNVLFSDELAKYGIWSHIDTLVRDPSISQAVSIVIVNGSAFELMRKDYPEHPRTGRYISKLIEKEANTQAIPEVTLYHFAREYFDDGIDPVAPMLRQEGDNMILDGIGLFQDDRYVTKIHPDKGIIFSILKRKFKEGQIKINIEKEDGHNKEIAMLSSVQSKRSYTVKQKGNKNFKVTIDIEIRGSILEYIGDKNLGDEKARRLLEKQIGEFIKKETAKIVQEMQENNVDSLGMGKYVRNSLNQREWQKLNWREVYPDVEVAINTKVKIKDYGKFN
jgi:spore germination protein